VMNLGPQINTGKDDFGFVLDNQSKFGYLSSNRDGGVGDDDIYAITALRPLKVNYMVRGVAYEKGTNTPLALTKVEFKNAAGEVIGTTTTTESGAYAFDAEPSLAYSLSGTKEKYFEGVNKFNTDELGDKTEIVKDVYLEKDPGLALRALVTDGKTGDALEGVKLKITDLKTGETFIQELTPLTGDVLKPITNKKVGDALSYKIELQKEGYFPKQFAFNHTIIKPGIINVHEMLAGSLIMDKEVKDIRELVVINDIRFDLNKFNIRADAAAELDKVVAVMNKYPNMVVELGAHTDCRATVKYNATLSDKRAKASAAYIKARISNPTRIYGKGYGESRLLNDCSCEGAVKSSCSEEEHQKNRRTEFKIISVGDNKVDVINKGTDSFDKK
jgi:outer membrane protein OmpA-like peptidoglycan-associated protein